MIFSLPLLVVPAIFSMEDSLKGEILSLHRGPTSLEVRVRVQWKGNASAIVVKPFSFPPSHPLSAAIHLSTKGFQVQDGYGIQSDYRLDWDGSALKIPGTGFSYVAAGQVFQSHLSGLEVPAYSMVKWGTPALVAVILGLLAFGFRRRCKGTGVPVVVEEPREDPARLLHQKRFKELFQFLLTRDKLVEFDRVEIQRLLDLVSWGGQQPDGRVISRLGREVRQIKDGEVERLQEEESILAEVLEDKHEL